MVFVICIFQEAVGEEMNLYKFYEKPGELDLHANWFHIVPDLVYDWAKYLGGRYESGERVLASEAKWAYLYALNVLEGRFEKGESVIATDIAYSYYYACDVLGDRFEAGESIMATDAEVAYHYARNVLKKRFKAGEEAIKIDGFYSGSYERFFGIKL